MEGSNLSRVPRTMFSCPIELRVGERTIVLKRAAGNLSLTGIFLQVEKLPLDAAVHVKIASVPPVELDGVVRSSHAAGVGIEFTALNGAARQGLLNLIAEFVPRETPSA